MLDLSNLHDKSATLVENPDSHIAPLNSDLPETREIPLSNGGIAIVDVTDYELLSHWKWKRHKHGYACRTATGGHQILMHRQIMGDPEGMDIDHRDLNKLNNVRSNLRIVTHARNGLNRHKQCNNTSGFKGVSFDRSRNKWSADIKVDGVRYRLGRFDTPEAAAAAYDEAAFRLIGPDARTNKTTAKLLVEANCAQELAMV